MPAADRVAAPLRPKILFLVHRVPHPPNRGDRIRSFHLLEFLAERADVSLAFLAEEPPSQDTCRALSRRCEQFAGIPLGRCRRWVNAAGSLARGRTATEGLFQCRPLRRLLARWAKATRFDAAVVYCSSMFQYLDVPGLSDVPAIVDLVDVDSQKWLEYAKESRGVPRWLYRIEGKRLRRLEQSLAPRANAILLTSGCEVELYRSFCSTGSVHAIPNGVNLDYFHPRGGSDTVAAREGTVPIYVSAKMGLSPLTPAPSLAQNSIQSPRDCVFVGALDYRANIDGIKWFCKEIWPEVRRRRPDATFTLVGSRPSPLVRRLAERPGIRLAADVPDVRPYLAEAALVVVPLRIARGIQNKVLEALAMAKAVIATPQALEGIGVDPETHVRAASTPAEWIEATVELLDDESARRRLGHAGRSYVEAHHCWDRQLQPLAEMLSTIVPCMVRNAG